jgi:galactose mutarotase-like enzyme
MPVGSSMNLRIFQNQPVVELCHGTSRALVSPAHGARVLRWDVGDWTVIGWPETVDWGRPQKARGGDPVLFPFIARSYHEGRIGCWKAPDGGVRPAPMHGFARDSAFSVVEAGADFVVMRLEANETTRAVYPFDFRFEVTIRLDADSMESAFRVVNTGDKPLPWSAGHHFYFHIPADRRADWELELPCREWGGQDFSNGKIQTRPAGAARELVSDPAWIDRFHLAPELDGVRLSNPGDGRSISFEDASVERGRWYCVTTWTEKPESDFFCVEPWSALPNAAANGFGLQTTPPGAVVEMSCRLRARDGN